MNNVIVHTFPQVKKIANEQQFVYGEVVDQHGNLAISGNSGKVKVKDWLRNKVEPMVKTYPAPGIYLIKFYTDKQKRALPHSYAVHFGNAQLGDQPQVQNGPNGSVVHFVQQPAQEKVLTPKEIFDMQQELADLRAKNNYLEKGGDPAKLEEGEEEEEEEEERVPTLAETLSNTFKTLAEAALPIVSEIYKGKDRNLQLKWAQFVAANPQFAEYSPYKMPVPNQPPPETTHGGVHPLLNACDEWLQANVEKQQPEMYEQIIDLSEQSQSFEEFCKNMNLKFPDVYKAMYLAINNPQPNESTQ